MVHACACCRLRFVSTGELADHVRTEHTEYAPCGKSTVSVVRQHYPERPAHRPAHPRVT